MATAKLLRTKTGMYPGRLGDRYSGLEAQTLAPKNLFSVFVFFSCISTKKCVAINDFTMHLNISKWLRKQNLETGEKNNETKRRQSDRRYCLRKCFHLFKYVIDHKNVCAQTGILFFTGK